MIGLHCLRQSLTQKLISTSFASERNRKRPKASKNKRNYQTNFRKIANTEKNYQNLFWRVVISKNSPLQFTTCPSQNIFLFWKHLRHMRICIELCGRRWNGNFFLATTHSKHYIENEHLLLCASRNNYGKSIFFCFMPFWRSITVSAYNFSQTIHFFAGK